MVKARVFNKFIGSKVINVGSKKYTSLDKIYPILDNKDIIIVLREIELKESSYKHPVKGEIFSYKFQVVNNSTKVYMTLHEWESMEDINKKKYNIDIK